MNYEIKIRKFHVLEHFAGASSGGSQKVSEVDSSLKFTFSNKTILLISHNLRVD